MEHTGGVQTVRLTSENWITWKFQTLIMFKSKGLYDITKGFTPKPNTPDNGEWERRDAKAQEIIATRVEERILTYILSCNTAAQMWEKLTSVFEQKSQVSIAAVLSFRP